MFLRGSLHLVPVSLLDKPQLETPSWTQKTTVTSPPAGCPGKGQPRDTLDGGSKVSTSNKTEEGTPGQISPLRKDLRQYAKDFTCAAKQTGREERCFLGPPPPRAMPTNTGKRKPGQVFLSTKNSSQHAQDFTCAAKLT